MPGLASASLWMPTSAGGSGGSQDAQVTSSLAQPTRDKGTMLVTAAVFFTGKANLPAGKSAISTAPAKNPESPRCKMHRDRRQVSPFRSAPWLV